MVLFNHVHSPPHHFVCMALHHVPNKLYISNSSISISLLNLFPTPEAQKPLIVPLLHHHILHPKKIPLPHLTQLLPSIPFSLKHLQPTPIQQLLHSLIMGRRRRRRRQRCCMRSHCWNMRRSRSRNSRER